MYLEPLGRAGNAMNKNVGVCLMILAVLLGWSPDARAGAWTVPKGHYYVEWFNRYFIADEDFDGEGKSQPKALNGKFSDFRTEAKIEAGITDRLNLLASIPIQFSNFEDDNGELKNSGIGDVWIRAKYRMMDKPVVTAVQVSAKIPEFYDEGDAPALGRGQWDLEARFIASRSFFPEGYFKHMQQNARSAWPDSSRSGNQRAAARRQMDYLSHYDLQYQGSAYQTASRTNTGPPHMRPRHNDWTWPPPWYVSGELGFRARGAEPTNEFPYFFETGFAPKRKMLIKFALDGVQALGKHGLDDVEEEFLKWALSVVFTLKGNGFGSVFREAADDTLDLEVGIADTFAGKNTANAFELFLKLAYSF